MDRLKKILQIQEIHGVLQHLDALTGTPVLYQKNDRTTAYLFDNKYMFRISKSKPSGQKQQNRSKDIPFVPIIHASGVFQLSACTYHYLIQDYVQGDDLWSAVQSLSNSDQKNIGAQIGRFLDKLHALSDDAYDIGHYIPAVPRYKGSWRDGHMAYIDLLKRDLSGIPLEPKSEKTILAAFSYMEEHLVTLNHQTGPRLLHNDFHPKNIIVHDGKLTGIIDWECSQSGEEDFELTHLFHWCIYPPFSGHPFDALLKSLINHLQIISRIPELEKRLTIYQLEHEINQLIWNGKPQEDERMLRINGWLNGAVKTILHRWQLI